MGRHVAGEVPELDRLVDDACVEIGRELDALRIPHLAGVVLGGGYGRGEGGAREKLESKVEAGETRALTLSNDLDFFAIVAADAPADINAIGAALNPMSKKWTERLGVDVDFTVKTPWRLRHDQKRLMIQELVRGFHDVSGTPGEELFRDIERLPADALPWTEAARLLVNRGMGLMFAMAEYGESCSSKLELEKGKVPLSNSNSELELCRKRDFVNRNINKCVLGAGDAKLVSRHAYEWRAEDRARALDDELYSAAVAWKFRPRSEAPCDWEAAREAWLSAADETLAAGRRGGDSRSFYQMARWIVRRRTLGDIASLGREPVSRMLRRLVGVVRERRGIPAALRRDWEIFN